MPVSRSRPKLSEKAKGNHSSGGFTLIEAAVTAAALGLIMIAAFGLFGRLGQVAMTNDSLARTQSDVRVAMDEIEKSLRSAGAEIDYALGQHRFVYADAYQVAFNANIEPAIDDGTGAPSALRMGSGSGVPNDANAFYVPTRTYRTGAETIVLGLDSNNDGAVTSYDKSDDFEEASGSNINDYLLYRKTYGWDGNSNDVETGAIALVRGPEPDDQGVVTAPLFSYLIDVDDDRATPPVLHGDTDGDRELSQTEILNLTPLAMAQLARIESIRLTVTGETVSPDASFEENSGYRRMVLESEVKIRQQPRTTAIVYGMVFKDQNANGVWEANEPTISDVTIQSSTGTEVTTDGNGMYRLFVSPGVMTITEQDPNGYTSSTDNDVTVDLFPGAYEQVNFGDITASGVGSIYGVVFHDENESGWQDDGEVGLPGIKLYADTGEYTYSQSDGSYWLDVPVGPRVVTEVDGTGFLSTTSNSVEAQVNRDGDTVEVNFGDTEAGASGTIEGYVYVDTNRDGARDAQEPGVMGAQVVAGGFSTESDNQGFFSLTVPAGNYAVTEIDPPGYTSTTPNTIHGVHVVEDETVVLYFGDMEQEDVEFDIIELANTERALSMGSGNLKEDNRGDPDLILGTRFAGGSNNLLVWYNNRRNANTANSAIFDATPDETRASVADVVAIDVTDFDDDGDHDVVTGLATPSISNLNVWSVDGGTLPNSPSYSYMSQGGEAVLDVCEADMNNDGVFDLVVGIRDSDTEGHLEVWWGRGGGEFTRGDEDVYRYDAGSPAGLLGAVTAVAAGDVNQDGWTDVAVASVDAFQKSSINVYQRIPSPSATYIFEPMQKFFVFGSVTDLAIVDMMEDADHDLDLVICTQHWETMGGVELWHQNTDGFFGLITESARAMDDWMPTEGAPLSLLIAYVDNDVFPDLIVGTRSVDPYGGVVQLARSFGHLPSQPTTISPSGTGTVMTMTANDFNLDTVVDFAIGTQNGSSTGQVIVFFGR